MDPQYSHGPPGQPGLEVVVDQHGLELATQEHLGHSLPEVRADEYVRGGKESIIYKYPGPQYSQYPEHYYTLPPPPEPVEAELAAEQPGRKKRLWWIVGGAIAVVVVLAAVLGGVLGSRAARSSGDASSSGASSSSDTGGGQNPSPSSTTSASTPSSTATRPQSIRQGSGLSITGWRKPDGNVETYLFYQDPQDGLRFSRCDASRRSPGNDSTGWASPVGFNSYAKAGTHLAASTILWGDQYQPQIELFYAGFNTRLLAVNFNEASVPNTTDDSANQVNINTSLDGGLTAYWPWTLYQDATGVLYHLRNQMLSLWNPSTTWDNNRLNTTALTASRMAVVPMSSNFTRIALKGGYAVFYQAPNAKLAVAITDLDSPQLARDYPLSWPPTALPDITLPKLAPMAAFSVARPADAFQRVDTYLLYRDADSNINMVYAAGAASSSASSTTSAVQWKTAQPAALKAVDADSDIACLNMATSYYNAAKVPVLLEAASEETRCYFQRGGRVVEARLDAAKADWVVVGAVPMP